MRLNRLDLIRYGRFKDAEICFPKPADGKPDVTVVFGQNEAGKSTAFNGFLELLFGFKGGAHPYAFRFDRSDLVVGAELDLPERGTTVLRRNSKRTQSLLDSNERPQTQHIAAELGMTDGAVRVALHRMKTRLGDLIRQEIADTLPPADPVDDEIRQLKQILEQSG